MHYCVWCIKVCWTNPLVPPPPPILFMYYVLTLLLCSGVGRSLKVGQGVGGQTLLRPGGGGGEKEKVLFKKTNQL